ncbi:SLOG family protein [Microbacterium gorillae]|uniref:SLOG family protein n=1 Tax=Microbacterium gorillae TaxID=1231063 RepID=UPI003D97378A
MTSFHMSLTGHRPNKLDGYDLSTPFYDLLRQTLRTAITGALDVHEHVTLHSGLALGADTVWSTMILEARAAHPGRVAFVAEVPTMLQSGRWHEGDQAFWRQQMASADAVNVYASEYSPRAMQLRNEGMVRAANLLLAVWDGSSSGTGHAVRYAGENGVLMHAWHPDEFRA